MSGARAGATREEARAPRGVGRRSGVVEGPQVGVDRCGCVMEETLGTGRSSEHSELSEVGLRSCSGQRRSWTDLSKSTQDHCGRERRAPQISEGQAQALRNAGICGPGDEKGPALRRSLLIGGRAVRTLPQEGPAGRGGADRGEGAWQK